MTSFATILIMWASHHGIFKSVYRADTPFLFANGLLLLLVTVVPFPTSLVAQYLSTPAAALVCAVYAGVFVVINVAYNLLWWTAARQRHLLYPTVTPRQVKRLSCFPERRAHYSCTQLWGFSGRRAKMCVRPPSPLAYLSSQEDQSAQGKETRYDVTRLDILEAFGFAGPSVSGLIDH